mmetsp:Transcript_31624/g.73790  ORF Transcript_31624/g.73790 Transcript_31624/m.73790 type:complete len:619 (+) Transcript_31624:89-1945(+)
MGKPRRPSIVKIKEKTTFGIEDYVAKEMQEFEMEKRALEDDPGAKGLARQGSNRSLQSRDSNRSRGYDGSPFSSKSRQNKVATFADGPAEDDGPEGDVHTQVIPEQVKPRRRLSQVRPQRPRRHRGKKKQKWTKSRIFSSDPTELAFGSVLLFMAGFMLVVMLLLVLFSLHYIFATVHSTREWYVLHGSATWAKAKARSTLLAAEQVWTGLHVSAARGGLGQATRYRILEQSMAPVFLAAPHVREVELDFGAVENTGLIVHVGRAETDFNQLEIRTSAADCFLLGVESCLIDVMPFGTEVRDMAVGDARWDPQGYLRQYQVVSWASASGDAHGGADADSPVMTGQTAWFLTIRMYFQLPFVDPSRLISLSSSGVAARVTLEVKDLFANGLLDDRLGEDGSIYLCSSGGYILAAQSLDQVLHVNESFSNSVQPRPIWTLGTSWASQLEQVFAVGLETIPDAGMLLDGDPEVSMVLHRLDGAFDSFVVVVVAPDWGEFANETLLTACFLSIGLVTLLMSVGCIAGVCVLCRKAPKQAIRQRVSIALKRSNSWRRSLRSSVSGAVSKARRRLTLPKSKESRSSEIVPSPKGNPTSMISHQSADSAELPPWRATVMAIDDDA